MAWLGLARGSPAGEMPVLHRVGLQPSQAKRQWLTRSGAGRLAGPRPGTRRETSAPFRCLEDGSNLARGVLCCIHAAISHFVADGTPAILHQKDWPSLSACLRQASAGGRRWSITVIKEEWPAQVPTLLLAEEAPFIIAELLPYKGPLLRHWHPVQYTSYTAIGNIRDVFCMTLPPFLCSQ